MIGVVPPEILVAGVAVLLAVIFGGWAWRARAREGALRAWLEAEAAAQKGRERFDAEQGKSSGGLGRRVRDRVRKRRNR